MNYTISTTKYIFKNLFYITLLAIIPCVWIGYLFDWNSTYAVLDAFLHRNLQSLSFIQIFNTFSIFCFSNWQNTLISLLGFIIAILFVCMLLALVEKHLRIGKRTLNGLLRRINDNFLSTLLVAFVYTIIYHLWALVLSSILFAICSNGSSGLSYFLIVFLIIVMTAVLLLLVSLFYFWLPCMQLTGFTPFESLRYSNQLSETIKWEIILPILFNLLIGTAIIIITTYLSNSIVSFFVVCIIGLFYILNFLVRMEISYFNVAKIERKDIENSLKY